VQPGIRRHVISHIIIDGYNVIGIFHKDMEKAREEFVNLLIRYKNLKNHDLTVVFDGHKKGVGNEKTAVRGGVKIIFSRIAERADDVIKRIITSEKKEWIVASSDRDIINHAWSVNSIPIPSERFFEIVSRHVGQGVNLANEETADELSYKDFEEDGYSHACKGNPYQLSKKEKAIRRALGKL
jgi:predicted RNA-binding protein with PIN domain